MTWRASATRNRYGSSARTYRSRLPGRSDTVTLFPSTPGAGGEGSIASILGSPVTTIFSSGTPRVLSCFARSSEVAKILAYAPCRRATSTVSASAHAGIRRRRAIRAESHRSPPRWMTEPRGAASNRNLPRARRTPSVGVRMRSNKCQDLTTSTSLPPANWVGDSTSVSRRSEGPISLAALATGRTQPVSSPGPLPASTSSVVNVEPPGFWVACQDRKLCD